MSERELKPHGVIDPTKKPTWLKEVKLDAARNTVEHLRRQQEQRDFEAAKARGVTVEEIISKGREDLDVDAPVNAGSATVTEPQREENSTVKSSVDQEELARLKAELKAERTRNTKLQKQLEQTPEEKSEEEVKADESKKEGKE